EGHPTLSAHVAAALKDQRCGLGMQHEGLTHCLCGTATRMVVRRGANTAERKDHVGASQGLAHRSGDVLRLVTEEACPAQAQPALAQQFDGFGQVRVTATAAEDFVANDEDADHDLRTTST